MKIRINQKIIISFIILSFISCNFVIAEKDIEYSSKIISKIQIDVDLIKEIGNVKLNKIDKSNDFIIGDIEIVIDDYYSNELFFIVNLIPKGFIIISADYNLPPIIAYSLNSNIDKDNLLIELIKGDINLRLENIKKIPDYLIIKRNSMWDDYLSNNRILLKKFEQWPPEGTTATEGWVLTTWSQSSPYNDFCPIDPALFP